MACPDELTLDLWLADALPSDEATTVAVHVYTCPTCAAAVQAVRVVKTEVHAALALDADELAYLAGLELASTWRTSPAAAALSWGWIALAGVVAGFAAWFGAGQQFGSVIAAVARVGLGTLPLDVALGSAFSLGQALFALTRNPALGLSQPLLALLALALLFWPHQFISQRNTHS
jgi:anti-sigma factor RsiW